MNALPVVIVVLVAAAIIAAGCTSRDQNPESATAGALLSKGEVEYQHQNFHAATSLFTAAKEAYAIEGNTSASRHARDRASVARMMVLQYPYNRSEIEAIVAERFPDASAGQRESWLTPAASMSIGSDNETWYFDRTVNNIMYHNVDVMQESTRARGGTPFYDQMLPFAFGTPVNGTGLVYRDPVTWEGVETLSIPAGSLPTNGTFRVWIPLPIETDSQRNVTIVSIEPERYLRSQTGTGADIGVAYFEIPLEEVNGSHLNISAKFRFTAYEQRSAIDPVHIGRYNESDPDYIRYTTPSRNIALTPGLREEARQIVGKETNPYKKAQKIYRHVTGLPYSSLSYPRLLANDSSNLPVSEFVRTTGWGDCGAQSAYFAALCRAAGIPARAIGGRQMIPGYGGGHFWSEYYLPGYGWIPNDVTIAEGADWSYNATGADRERYREYYAGNLDPYRLIFQKDVDIPLVPDPGDLTTQDFTFQDAKAMCDTCPVDPIFWLSQYGTMELAEV